MIIKTENYKKRKFTFNKINTNTNIARNAPNINGFINFERLNEINRIYKINNIIDVIRLSINKNRKKKRK